MARMPDGRWASAAGCHNPAFLDARVKKGQKKCAGEITDLQTCAGQKSGSDNGQRRKTRVVSEGSGASPCQKSRWNEDENLHPSPEDDAEHDRQRNEDKPESSDAHGNQRDLLLRPLTENGSRLTVSYLVRVYIVTVFEPMRNLAARQGPGKAAAVCIVRPQDWAFLHSGLIYHPFRNHEANGHY